MIKSHLTVLLFSGMLVGMCNYSNNWTYIKDGSMRDK